MEEEKTLHKIYFVGDHQFTRQNTYYDPIGICMNDNNIKKKKIRKKKESK